MSAKRGGLGTNLDSLIPTSLTVAGNEVAQQNEVSVDAISPNPRQPRTIFEEGALNELIASIETSFCCATSFPATVSDVGISESKLVPRPPRFVLMQFLHRVCN